MKSFLIACIAVVVIAGPVMATGQPEDMGPEVLRVGMDLRYPPFETRDENGDPSGISVDVARAFGDFVDRPVEIVDTNFASLIPSLNAGEIDIIIASMSRTDERDEAIDFSDPYFYFKIISLVNAQWADASGVTEDATTEELTNVDGVRFTGITGQVSASIPQSLGFDVEIATNLETGVLNVVQGSADVLMMSSFPVTRGYRANPDDTIVIWDPFVSSPIAMGVREGDSELQARANEFVALMDEPGGVYDQLEEEWDATVRALLGGRFGLEFFINED